MKNLRIMLAILWTMLAVSSAAHATAVTTSAPCHMPMDMMQDIVRLDVQHRTPPLDQNLMPCCNQPAMIAPDASPVPMARKTSAIQFTASPAATLVGLSTFMEPRPPKNA